MTAAVASVPAPIATGVAIASKALSRPGMYYAAISITAATDSITHACQLPSQAKPSDSSTHPIQPAKDSAQRGKNTRRPTAAAKATPSAIGNSASRALNAGLRRCHTKGRCVP